MCLCDVYSHVIVGIINLHEVMAKGYDRPWTTWKCLNRLRTGVHLQQDTKKEVEGLHRIHHMFLEISEETAVHIFQCSQPSHLCYLDNLITFNGAVKQCAELWKKMAW